VIRVVKKGSNSRGKKRRFTMIIYVVSCVSCETVVKAFRTAEAAEAFIKDSCTKRQIPDNPHDEDDFVVDDIVLAD
jgi:predicted metal-binding protein